MDVNLAIYLSATFVVGLAFILWINSLIARAEKNRLKRVKTLKRMEAVSTSSPLKNPVKAARESALGSIESRFSIIRRLFLIAVLCVWLFLLVVPFLSKIPTAVVSVVIGSSAVVVGIASRPFVENVIAGMVITFSRLFRTGDTVVIDGYYGTIEDITITHTIVKKWNWRRYVIPNTQMLTKELVNYTLNDAYQWVHVEFWVDYEADLSQVRQAAVDAAQNSPCFAGYETPQFWVMEMGKEGIRCWLAAWADNPTNAWMLSHDVRTGLAAAFRTLGIAPHRFNIITQSFPGPEENGKPISVEQKET
jgi:small-conductance mechanosensitive channel